MQVKVVIGTIAFMLTMIILGYAALREPERLEHFTGARDGRTIETGANILSITALPVMVLRRRQRNVMMRLGILSVAKVCR